MKYAIFNILKNGKNYSIDERHYKHPNIIWYLSEAIIDPLLNNDTFKRYTNFEIRSYNIFYETFIGEESIIDTLRRIISEKSIELKVKKQNK